MEAERSIKDDRTRLTYRCTEHTAYIDTKVEMDSVA